MILMGIVVGLPTAIVVMFVCKLINRFVNIPMRPYTGGAELEPLPDSDLPPLWLSLLPIVLPVILISANTIATVFSDKEHVSEITPGIVSAQIESSDENAKTLAEKLVNAKIVSDLGNIEELTKKILKAKIRINNDESLALAQKLTSAAVFGDGKHTGPAQKAEDVTAILGNPNLALFLSAVIAMFMLAWKRKISLKKLTEAVDESLMSGGIIILITAGGGAFGAMLREAGIQKTIESYFASSGQNVSIMIFVAAFAVSAMLKIAQGSSTVAMITTSSMFAAMGFTTDMLGCNFVYLALTIGGGSLVGTWMNDSGFWIVARMGVLSELETLKSWTIISATCGTVSSLIAVLLSRIIPLV
jgi:H+/gluconate symporter-like permease